MNHTNLYTPTDFFAAARDEAEVDNLLNTDVYKFLMLDFILANPEYKDLNVKRQMTIRSKGIRTAEVIPLAALTEQLEATKGIQGVSEADLSYLRGMTTKKGLPLFKEETLQFLKTFRLPDYKIGIDATNNYTLEFTGPRSTSTMREIYGLKIINSLYLYHYIKKAKLNTSEFNQIINESMHRLYQDIAILKSMPDVTVSEFGARRCLSTDYQRAVFSILSQSLPRQCVGTSSVLISRESGQNNPKGTNAHELRMIPLALEDDPQKVIQKMYEIDRQWAKHFPELAILLPDTYGSSFYFDNCPDDVAATHIGCRFDSKDPIIAIPEYVDFLKKHHLDPQSKMGIASDGLTAQSSVDIFRTHQDKLGLLTFGIGTNLTNNTSGTWPRAEEPFGKFGSFSVVVKPAEVQRPDGTRVSCVKLSDNPSKAVGEKTRVELFKTIFGVAGTQQQDVLV